VSIVDYLRDMCLEIGEFQERVARSEVEKEKKSFSCVKAPETTVRWEHRVGENISN
jgi:hypothetical protein